MTEENKRLREKVKGIEALCATCLQTQPDEDGKCEIHLKQVLAKIADYTREFQGLAEVEAYDIVWDTDDKDPKELGLPKSMRLMVDLAECGDIAEDIANILSDRSGWCVKSLNYRRI